MSYYSKCSCFRSSYQDQVALQRQRFSIWDGIKKTSTRHASHLLEKIVSSLSRDVWVISPQKSNFMAFTLGVNLSNEQTLANDKLLIAIDRLYGGRVNQASASQRKTQYKRVNEERMERTAVLTIQFPWYCYYIRSQEVHENIHKKGTQSVPNMVKGQACNVNLSWVFGWMAFTLNDSELLYMYL